MGCQVSCGEFEINYSDGAWLAAYMTYPWRDEKRDTDGEGYWWSLHSSSIALANNSVPWFLDEFIEWFEKNVMHWDAMKPASQQDFDTARQFIKNAASTGESASLSH